MHMHEDFFEVMILLCPGITIQPFGITTTTLTIQLPPMVSFTLSINSLQLVETPSYCIHPILLRQILFLLPQEPVCAFELFYCKMTMFTSSYVPKIHFFHSEHSRRAWSEKGGYS